MNINVREDIQMIDLKAKPFNLGEEDIK